MTTVERARLPVHYEFLSEEDNVSGKFVEPSGRYRHSLVTEKSAVLMSLLKVSRTILDNAVKNRVIIKGEYRYV